MSNSVSSVGATGAVLSQIDVLVALKAKNAQKAQGEAAIKLMDAAVKIAQGQGGVSADGHVDLVA